MSMFNLLPNINPESLNELLENAHKVAFLNMPEDTFVTTDMYVDLAEFVADAKKAIMDFSEAHVGDLDVSITTDSSQKITVVLWRGGASTITVHLVDVLKNCIEIVMPTTSKIDTLSEVDKECAITKKTTRALVVQTCLVSPARFDYLANNFLTKQPEWEYVGGCSIEPEHVAGLNSGSMSYWYAWEKYGYTKVTQITNDITGETFYIDSQGYDYARYVGRPLNSHI